MLVSARAPGDQLAARPEFSTKERLENTVRLSYFLLAEPRWAAVLLAGKRL